MTAELTVANPVANVEARDRIEMVGRPTDLGGKRIGLYWNMKPGGKAALEHVEDRLRMIYPDASFIHTHGSVGASVRHLTKDDADALASNCDVVVGTTGDCGGCTLWLAHDMAELERRGVPTVGMVAEHFIPDYRRAGDSMGSATLPIAVLSAPLVNQTRAVIEAMIDVTVEDIVRQLAVPPAADKAGSSVGDSKEKWLSFSGADLLTAQDAMNERFREWQWSDGLPLRPATSAEVDRMLAGTTRSPDELITTLEPGRGLATVEKIAINAVMAGCQPQHLPIVVAAVECLGDPRNLREKVISTGPAAPMIVVNGPARERAGLNTGVCMLGPGSPSFSNTVIGRAVRLCMMNIGLAYPGVSDMDTQGSPNKYSMCVAENEENSPWEPYQSVYGVADGASSVTVGYVYGLVDLHDAESTGPESLVKIIATATRYLGANSAGYWLMGHRADPRFGSEEQEHHFVLLSPHHAKIFGDAGWSRADVSEALWREARERFGFVSTKLRAGSIRASHPELGWLWDSPDTRVPLLEEPGCFDVIVAGASGSSRTSYAWGMGGPVTKPIPDSDLSL